MWTPQVTWPSGVAATCAAASAEISRARTVAERRGLIMSLPRSSSMGHRTTSAYVVSWSARRSPERPAIWLDRRTTRRGAADGY